MLQANDATGPTSAKPHATSALTTMDGAAPQAVPPSSAGLASTGPASGGRDAMIDALVALVGAGNVISPGPDQEPYVVDWRGRYRGQAIAVVRPGNTQEVSAVVRLCAAHGVAVVPRAATPACAAQPPRCSPAPPWWCGSTACAASWT